MKGKIITSYIFNNQEYCDLESMLQAGANYLQTPEDEVLKIHEEVSSLKLQGSHLFSDLNIYSLKTSKDSSTMTEELHLRPSSEPWMNWGTMWNGKILTAKILESPKTGSACSLSAILEENVPEEFFLSQKVASKLLQSKNSTAIPLQPDTETHKAQGRTLLKVNRRK